MFDPEFFGCRQGSAAMDPQQRLMLEWVGGAGAGISCLARSRTRWRVFVGASPATSLARSPACGGALPHSCRG